MDEFITQSLIVVIGIPYFLYLLTFDYRWIQVIIYNLVAIFIHDAIKKASIGVDYQFLKRPIGAINCDLCSKNGNQSGKPGFPSGHVTTAAAFFTSIYLLFPEYRENAIWVGILYTVLMAGSRISKRCHTLLQTVAGTVLGVGVSVGLHKIM